MQPRPGWRALSTADAARVVDEVAHELGNTRAVCRKHYVDPRIVEAFLAGELRADATPAGPQALSVRERDLLGFLESHAEGGTLRRAA